MLVVCKRQRIRLPGFFRGALSDFDVALRYCALVNSMSVQSRRDIARTTEPQTQTYVSAAMSAWTRRQRVPRRSLPSPF